MIQFKEVKSLIQRANVAYENYQNFQNNYINKTKGFIYEDMRNFHYKKLQHYEKELKTWSDSAFAEWSITLVFNNNTNDTYNIILPNSITKLEVELLIPFKLPEVEQKEYIVTDVHKVSSPIITGKLIKKQSPR